MEEALLDHPGEQFVRYIQNQQDNDRENPPGNTMEQLLNKAQDKMDHIELMKAQAAAEGISSKEEVLALRAEVATLKKSVNKFKKGDKDKKIFRIPTLPLGEDHPPCRDSCCFCPESTTSL